MANGAPGKPPTARRPLAFEWISFVSWLELETKMTPTERLNESQMDRHRTEQVFYGWFDDSDQKEPTYDPPLGGPCALCGRHMVVMEQAVRTHSLMYRGKVYGKRSYFYRTHQSCAERDPTHTAGDGFILDLIARNGD